MNSLCIIIPVYNEETHIENCVNQVIKVTKEIKHVPLILIVNDGSIDNTNLILKKLSLKYHQLIIINHNKNKGYGAALDTGIKEALRRKFKFAIFMDSDQTNDPKYILNFYKYINMGYDCIKASRYINKGKMVKAPLYRRIISKIGNYIASKLFAINIHDCTNGFRMVRLDKLKKIVFKEKGFAIILEELYYLKKMKAKFKEIPTILTNRKNTTTKFRYKPTLFWDYLKYILKASLISYKCE